MKRYFVLRDGAFEWVDEIREGDQDFTGNDSAEEAQAAVDAYYGIERSTDGDNGSLSK